MIDSMRLESPHVNIWVDKLKNNKVNKKTI